MKEFYNITYFLLTSIIIMLVGSSCTDETKVTKVELLPSAIEMNIGETTQIEMIVTPLSATQYNPTAWQSSDTKVAKVDKNGNVTALYAGTCTITGQAGHQKASCRVTVNTPTYNLNLRNATIFNNGVADGSTSNHLVVRLHDESLIINSDGNITGNGQMLNISLFAPISTQHLPSGTYTTNTASKTDFSIEAGTELNEGGNTYATGSFLCNYTDNTPSVLYIKEGTITVNNDSTCNIQCVLEGINNEHIDAAFSGATTYYNTTTPSDVVQLYYTKCTQRPTEIAEETDIKHMSILFTTETDTMVALTARMPLSTHTLPIGHYVTSTKSRPYTIVSYTQTPTCIATRNDTINIASATLDIIQASNGAIEYSATLTDTHKKQYTLTPLTYKHQNIKTIKSTKISN